MTTATKIPLLFDPETKRVGCVLLQAAHGFGAGNWIVHLFDSRAWVTGEGYDGLRAIEGTVGEWKKAAEICNLHHARKK